MERLGRAGYRPLSALAIVSSLVARAVRRGVGADQADEIGLEGHVPVAARP